MEEQSAAERYDDYLARSFVPWVREIVTRAGPRPDEHVLDLACGTGVVIRQLAPLLGPEGRLVGSDISADMLRVARERLPETDTPVQWIEASADEIPLPDSSFDLITCHQGFQFFPQRVHAAREMLRLLRPGGRIAMAVWRSLEHNPILEAMHAASERHLGYSYLLTPFPPTDAAVIREPLMAAGFTDISIEPLAMESMYPEPSHYVRMNFMSAAAAVSNMINVDTLESRARIEAAEAEVAPVVQQYVRGDTLFAPMAANIVVAIAPDIP